MTRDPRIDPRPGDVLRLEDIAKEKWRHGQRGNELGDVNDVSVCVNAPDDLPYDPASPERGKVAEAAPEMLALLLEQSLMATGVGTFESRKEWRDRRDALLARLRKEIEA